MSMQTTMQAFVPSPQYTTPRRARALTSLAGRQRPGVTYAVASPPAPSAQPLPPAKPVSSWSDTTEPPTQQARNPPPGRGGRAPRSPDYYANVGSVIEHLREDYPHLLEREPELTTYTENVIFVERSTGYQICGKRAYRNMLWALRVQMYIVFSCSSITIQSLFHDDDAGVIYLRWRLKARPRVWGLMRDPPTVVADAMSVYKLNANGLVCEHVLDNSAPVRPRLQPLIEDILALGTIRVRGTPEPVGAPAISATQATDLDEKTQAHAASRVDRLRKARWFATLDKAVFVPLPTNVDRSGVSRD